MGRFHISGGAPAAHQAIQNGGLSARELLALLAASGFPANGNNGLRAPRAVVGVDMTQLPMGDGTPPKVEWLPLTASAGTDIAAAATSDFELKPNKYFRPGPLVIDDDIAKNLIMTNLLIGGKPVFAGSGCVPCRLFAHTSVSNALSSYVATNSAPITFTLKNIHASATQTVRGVWVGDTQELAVG